MSTSDLPPISPTPSIGQPLQQATSFSFLSFSEKLGMLGSQLFETAKEKTISHPYVILGTIGAITAGCLLFKCFSTETSLSLNTLAAECKELCKRNNDAEAKNKISQYVTQFIKRQNDPTLFNEKNIEYFTNKLSKIIIDSEIPLESKLLILPNVQNDFIRLLAQTKKRTEQDIKSNLLKDLKISPHNSLTSIEALGNETHNQGNIPLLLTFSNGEKIVYKPRSMVPEQEICGKNDSVFKIAGLGTYTVVCRDDDNGSYGYCPCLYNRQNENTMTSIKEVENYLKQLLLMEKVCSQLGVSDVHFDNIITENKIAFFIDSESFLNPQEVPPGIFKQYGAGNTFNPTGLKETEGKNKIWLSPELTEKKKVDFKYEMTKKDLKTIGVDLDQIAVPDLDDLTYSRIEKARYRLQSLNGRFVLIDTQSLKSMLTRIDPNNPSHLSIFSETIQERLNQLQFDFVATSEEQIKEAFKNNVLHNDVPIFYYDSNKGTILYEDIVIGIKRPSNE